jgi:hypothetical protein
MGETLLLLDGGIISKTAQTKNPQQQNVSTPIQGRNTESTRKFERER